MQRHLRVGGVQRPHVDMIQAPLAAQEHLVQRPAGPHRVRRGAPGPVALIHQAAPSLARRAAFAAYAAAASRTHAPSVSADWRRAMR
jgi:hypothetical protein